MANTPLYTLYDKAECPFCWKVRLVCLLKGVALDEITIDTDAKPAEFLALSPKGKVPVLQGDGWILEESKVIVAFLEENHPEPALLSDAHALEIEAYSDKSIGVAIRDAIFMRRAQAPADWDHEVLERCQRNWDEVLTTLEAQCDADGPWFLGGNPSVADCALVARFALAAYYGLEGVHAYPRVASWWQRMVPRLLDQPTTPAAIRTHLMARLPPPTATQ